jgi:N-acetylmuramic acid 6-phosphate etherase
MKAGTATKLILNQITTLSMIQLGKVYENLMVDVQLRNSKLRDRARRILMELTGLDEESARWKIEASGSDLKVAIVMALADCNRDQARQTLDERQGHVAQAIKAVRSH